MNNKNLSPTILPQLKRNSKNENHSHCPACGSSTLIPGAGRKPQEASLHCSACKRFQRWISASELAGKGGER